MKRREFLKFSATGLTVVAVGSMAEWPMFWRGSNAYAANHPSLDRLNLEMVAVDAEMVTGVPVPMWAFKIVDSEPGAVVDPHHITVPRIPGPAMVALTGDRIRLRITNSIENGGTHGFAIPGVVDQVAIPTGDENRVDIEFIAPAPGTYIYHDPYNDPINRMMGLHGVLVVLPNPIGNNTPYLDPTDNIQALFDDLGTTIHLPGRPWDSARNVIWVFNVIDSARFGVVAGNQVAQPPSFFSHADGFLPDYFTINGKSGFFSAQHHHGSHGLGESGATGILDIVNGVNDVQANISFGGTVGQPMLIRSVNVGNFWHSPHIHGTHVYPLSNANINGSRDLLDNLTFLDTWSLAPGDIVDLLHPFNSPPDVPNWDDFVANVNRDELFPFVYPVHDHNEITNTAAGGNYPHGMATHWQIDHPFDVLDPATGVIFIDRAELRVRTGQLLIDGRFTVPNQHLMIHAGGADGPELNQHVMVDSNGNFSFRGRALKALASSFITLMHHGGEHDGGIHAVRTVPLTRR